MGGGGFREVIPQECILWERKVIGANNVRVDRSVLD